VVALYDAILIPALSLAEGDRHRNALEPERERFVLDTTRQVVEEIEDKAPAGEQRSCAHVCIIPAHDEADALAGAMLARLLPGAQVLSSERLAGGTLEKIGEDGCRTVCISAVPPHAASHAAYLARRLKRRFPELRIVVGLWTHESVDKIKPRLLSAGVDEVATRISEIAEQLRQVAP
jgi:hypothetical protein